ncbi:MAG TPA: trypsin-like peptidase domain-containing protein [Candidatus Polarisedimenticolaceae bacterium]|nr:trypsin-like peptidase domain-containing protein [Candidatus Polarisedimenticolaceae bacterium]
MQALARCVILLLAVSLAPGAERAEFTLPAPDVAALLLEDEALRGDPDVPYRVGFPRATDLSPANAGIWQDRPDGGQLWRLRVRSPGARWIVLGFGTFRLQPGGRLYVADAERRTVWGPFGAADVAPHGQLWFPPVPGDTALVELEWPAALRGTTPNIHLGTVSHGYKSWGGFGASLADEPPAPEPPDLLGSGSCNIDVNCPQGSSWQADKRGVVRLLSGGSSFCTGALVRAATNDCRPYVLTAAHCLSSPSEAAATSFQFNYERSACGGGTVVTNQILTGSTLRATFAPSDFTLLEMNAVPPTGYNAFLDGWNRAAAAATQSTGIHHPSGDVKKISFNDDALVDGQADGWGDDHWRVTDWEQGTTEPGSSGSPLYDQNHRIVGQLHGGTSSCASQTWDEYGKLAVSWSGGGTSGTRLASWLDPAGSGLLVRDGIDLNLCLTPRPQFVVTASVVEDPQGNGDGAIDPGEAVLLKIELQNTGTVTATQVLGGLSSGDGLVALGNPFAGWPDIPVAAQQQTLPPYFNVQVDPAHACGEPIPLQLTLQAHELSQNVVTALELPVGQALVHTDFQDSLESGAAGWTTQALVGSQPWALVTSDSFSPSHSWFIPDVAGRRDSVLLLPPTPVLQSRATLSFVHRFNTENSRDGGVLEYSTDGGASWLDAGPLIVAGGYNSSIGSGETSPLAGRAVWAGDSGGWQPAQLDLAPLAGQTVRFRFRFASNLFIGDEGWYVDDVLLESTSYSCHPLLAVPGEASPPGGSRPLTVFWVTDSPYALQWSPPIAGGAATRYHLYRTPLGASTLAPTCEATVGSNTFVILDALADDSGFLVVAANSLGEGAYGAGALGAERPHAAAAEVCP